LLLLVWFGRCPRDVLSEDKKVPGP